MAGEARERVHRPGYPVVLRSLLGGMQHGHRDPACRWDPTGRLWWATCTPVGDGLLSLQVIRDEVHARAWGEGADWLLDGVPELLGSRDNPQEFVPRHDVLAEAVKRRPGLRVMRTRRVLDAYAAACIEQRVTGKEAFFAWRRLLTRFGTPAPGPAQDPESIASGMRVPPTAEVWRRVPSWEWLEAGVDLSRRKALIVGARASTGLERTLALPGEQADAALRSLPGVGVWTSAEVRQRAHGDADAFSFADYHVAKNVSYALTGEVLDDDGCAEVIECYRGHRFRVQLLVASMRITRPRHGARFTLPTHTPSRQRVL